jgi:phosphoribosylformimino-5-aminoimidazole carboxamide ribotide isomerase
MQILPVIDIKNGIAVRGVAGERDVYRAVESDLSPDAQVPNIAHAFREHFGLSELYIADLDAILDGTLNLPLFRELQENGFELLIDAGLRDVERAQKIMNAGAKAVICGLETSPGPRHVEELLSTFGPEKVIFSLDMKNGLPMCDPENWGSQDPLEIARRCLAAGINRMIVLDLAGVGVGGGVAQLNLCQILLNESPGLELITGGGVRDITDLHTLKNAGIKGVLIASALHNGSITPQDLETLSS